MGFVSIHFFFCYIYFQATNVILQKQGTRAIVCKCLPPTRCLYQQGGEGNALGLAR